MFLSRGDRDLGGTVIVGLLVGLNVLDANLCLKGEDLDSQVRWEF